jgi:hypothetical protein
VEDAKDVACFMLYTKLVVLLALDDRYLWWYVLCAMSISPSRHVCRMYSDSKSETI